MVMDATAGGVAEESIGRNNDDALCAAALRAGSKSFHAASLLLPARLRGPVRALYAFCRVSDDLVDGGGNGQAAVANLKLRLDAIYAGRPMDLVADRAFAAVARDHAIPRAVPDAMIEGFAWDAQGRTYRSEADMLAYAARVAGTVGVMMTLVMGRDGRHTLARAADLGLAMQLTNIARDVGEDARNGRVYLPEDWLADEGLSGATLVARPQHSPALGRVVARLLTRADDYYRSGMAGIADLPADCRPAIRAAAAIYRAIGARIAANGHDSVSRRAHTGMLGKLAAATAALSPIGVSARADIAQAPPCPQTAFLVAAAGIHQPFEATSPEGRVGRFLELLQMLGEREVAMATDTAGATAPEG